MSYLTSKWALVHDKEGEDDKVCEKDNIRKKSGPSFVRVVETLHGRLFDFHCS